MIINDFYPDPRKVRKQALSSGLFPYVNEIPGARSKGVPIEESNRLRGIFQDIIGDKITEWHSFGREPGKNVNNTCFQMINHGETNWVHHDDTSWAGVIYLTPDANPDAGTGLFTHIETGVCQWDPNDPSTELNENEDRFDLSKWRCNLRVENKFNRLILYRGSMYHSSLIAGFGNNYENGRLTQVFFFNTEN